MSTLERLLHEALKPLQIFCLESIDIKLPRSLDFNLWIVPESAWKMWYGVWFVQTLERFTSDINEIVTNNGSEPLWHSFMCVCLCITYLGKKQNWPCGNSDNVCLTSADIAWCSESLPCRHLATAVHTTGARWRKRTGVQKEKTVTMFTLTSVVELFALIWIRLSESGIELGSSAWDVNLKPTQPNWHCRTQTTERNFLLRRNLVMAKKYFK